jgi:hypothetical protein
MDCSNNAFEHNASFPTNKAIAVQRGTIARASKNAPTAQAIESGNSRAYGTNTMEFV